MFLVCFAAVRAGSFDGLRENSGDMVTMQYYVGGYAVFSYETTEPPEMSESEHKQMEAKCGVSNGDI
jgi:hypothetical protein